MGKNISNGLTEDVSILSAGIKLEGKLYSDGNVRIDGTIDGNLTVNGNLTLGDKSVVKGEVRALNITLGGIVDGSANAEEKLVLETSGKLKGELIAKILIIEEGAQFDGNCIMNQTTAKSKVTEDYSSDESVC